MGCGASVRTSDLLSALEATSAAAFCNGMAQYSVRACFPDPAERNHQKHSRVMKYEIQGSGKLNGAWIEFVDPPQLTTGRTLTKKKLRFEIEFQSPLGVPVIKAKTYMGAGHVTLRDYFAEYLCNAKGNKTNRFSLSTAGEGGPHSAIVSPLDESAEALFTTLAWNRPSGHEQLEVQAFRGPLTDFTEAPSRSSTDCVARVPTRGGGGTTPTKYPLQMTICEDENVLPDEQLHLVVFLTLFELGQSFNAGWPGRDEYETFAQVEARK